MREILPDVFHWTAVHPKIHIEVSSYWIDDVGVLIDPLVPADGGCAWFAARPTPPRTILLSNRHHYRQSAEFIDAFGCEVLCNEAGLHEFTHGERVRGFAIGDVLPGSVVACEVGSICPDDTALYLPRHRAIAFADGAVRGGARGGDGPLGFVPDTLMDDPQRTKEGLLASFRALLADYDFDHILLAHGLPLIGDGRQQLDDLVTAGGRTAFML